MASLDGKNISMLLKKGCEFMDDNKGSHQEEKWVKNLCNEIRNNCNWKKDKYIILDNVALAHSISLNNFVKLEEKGNKSSITFIDDISSKELKNKTEFWNVDIFIGEKINDNGKERIIPRIVIEAKYKSINTHDPITYNHKAYLHKNLFNGLRYGVIIGNYDKERKEENVYIPTRVIEYGDNFDFIFLFTEKNKSKDLNKFIKLIEENLEISKRLEKLNNDKENKYQVISKNIEFEEKEN